MEDGEMSRLRKLDVWQIILLFLRMRRRKKIDQYWRKKHEELAERKAQQKEPDSKQGDDLNAVSEELTVEEERDSSEDWKVEVLEQIKNFSPKKFESFSRLLLSHMGIRFDREKV